MSASTITRNCTDCGSPIEYEAWEQPAEPCCSGCVSQRYTDPTAAYKEGDRLVFPHGYSLPHLSIYVPAGSAGEIVYANEWVISVRLDEPIPNLVDSEWENCIDFSIADDPGCVAASTIRA